MPWNINYPNAAEFGVFFFDNALGVAYTPSSAWVVLVYEINNVSNSSIVVLSASGGRWVGTWLPSLVGPDVPSDVTYTILSSYSPNPAEVGTIRLIDP